ncbi:hypothetical protein AVEN_172867-1 [Araneus ventricosus]|uniref:Uncharacterized protein n=1 Tax=Araneus ventricosus TaxID=182803 RepID=A0A4Y2RSI1_ARAVE|nr:hypothetical protein AVEN_235718-1 [Araneus ventricosus]GBN78797.1 hypothetical protein AVEN_172867-1 [Araneus ventricosus]
MEQLLVLSCKCVMKSSFNLSDRISNAGFLSERCEVQLPYNPTYCTQEDVFDSAMLCDSNSSLCYLPLPNACRYGTDSPCINGITDDAFDTLVWDSHSKLLFNIYVRRLTLEGKFNVHRSK